MSARPVITRADAANIGRKRFYTGTPCKQGHLSERMVSNGGCCQCIRESMKRLYRVRNGASLEYKRLIHPGDKEAMDAYAVALQTAREVAIQQPAAVASMAAARVALFPELATAGPDYAPAPFAPHPGPPVKP